MAQKLKLDKIFFLRQLNLDEYIYETSKCIYTLTAAAL